MTQSELTFAEAKHTGVIRLLLTPEQAEQLSPLALDAALNRKNVLFIATAVPFWSPEKEAMRWELQIAKIQAKAGGKIIKLILANTSG
jgi:hypothetical protein